jgi:catalase
MPGSRAKPPARSAAPAALSKLKQLELYRESPLGQILTTDQGVRVISTDDSLKAGERGPTLLEDFHLREKIMRFDHERIPERVVHARGAGAHGYFQPYRSMSHVTRAAFLQQPKVRTPVFARFSTVAGSRGSADVARDVRGFAVKFYTSEGNFDLVGNNMPVFFIQDGIKFPDLIHAVKPEPNREIPQAASAHDSFWDFIAQTPEAAHMALWLMSDRALPRSYRMMEGFGVHTFRLIDAKGNATLIKWHWKPVLGMHALVWDEAQLINGRDPDFHRRDLWEAIAAGHPAEFELGIQAIAEDDELAYGFDLLDPTKLLPEEIVPVEIVGKMVLDRNPENYFAEVEQAAFCIGNVVPGIDFTNDPLLQARLFSYLDTQITRLGGPNFAELPINRPIAPVHNHQHDGFARHAINASPANYLPNTLAGGSPRPATAAEGGFAHHMQRIDGAAIRSRSPSFSDHFSQARLFFDSLMPIERAHIVQAFSFELSHCDRVAVRQQVVSRILAPIDKDLARQVAIAVGISIVAVAPPALATHGKRAKPLAKAPSLSMAPVPMPNLVTRRIAILAAPGCVGATVKTLKSLLEGAGASVDVVGVALGAIPSSDEQDPQAVRSFLSTSSVLYDAVAVADGDASAAALSTDEAAIRFIKEAHRHCKAIASVGAGRSLLMAAHVSFDQDAAGVASDGSATDVGRAFIAHIKAGRHWARQRPQQAS